MAYEYTVRDEPYIGLTPNAMICRPFGAFFILFFNPKRSVRRILLRIFLGMRGIHF